MKIKNKYQSLDDSYFPVNFKSDEIILLSFFFLLVLLFVFLEAGIVIHIFELVLKFVE